jgi:hypothetical protein
VAQSPKLIIGRKISFVLIGVVCFYTTFRWHILNQSLPTWDGGQYFFTASLIRDQIISNPFSGLYDLYTNRIWRPIAFPSISALIIAPFQQMSTNIQVGIVQFISMFLLGIATHKIAIKKLGHYTSLIVVFFLISMPWLLEYSHEYFYSEPMWLAFLAWYLLKQIDFLSKNRRKDLVVSGLCLGLAFALRPAETLLFIVFPTIYFFYNQLKLGMKYKELVKPLSLATANLGLSIVNWKTADVEMLYTITIFMQILLLLYSVYTLIKNTKSLISVYQIAIIFCFSWYLPFYPMLYEWMYQSSFGSWAELSNLTYKDSSILFPIIKEFSYYAPRTTGIIILVFIVIIFLKVTLRTQPRKKERVPDHDFIFLFIVFVISLFPVLLMISISRATDPRKIMAQIYFILLFAMISSLSTNYGNLNKFVGAIVLSLFFLQVIYVGDSNNQLNDRNGNSQKLERQFGIIRPPFVQPDPNRALDAWISSQVGKDKKIAMYSHGLLATNTYIGYKLPIVNHTGLSLASLESKSRNYYHYSADLLFNKENEFLLRNLRSEDYDYLVLDMFEGPIGSEVNREQGLYKTTSFLLSVFSKSREFTINSVCSFKLQRQWCFYKIGDSSE